MLAIVVGLSFGLPAVGTPMVRPGMPLTVVSALVREKPTILNRTNGKVREIEYPRAGLTLTLDDEGRVLLVSNKGEEISAEKELARVTKALPDGLKRLGFGTVLKPGEQPDKETEALVYTRIRVARMTSDTTAKITLSTYRLVPNERGEEEVATLSVYLSWYRDCWTVNKHEGSVWSESTRLKLFACIDEAAGKRP